VARGALLAGSGIKSDIQQPSPPVIVKIMDPPGDPSGLSDVLIGALGLTGALVLIAMLLAAVFAGLLFLWRSRSTASPKDPEDLHIV